MELQTAGKLSQETSLHNLLQDKSTHCCKTQENHIDFSLSNIQSASCTLAFQEGAIAKKRSSYHIVPYRTCLQCWSILVSFENVELDRQRRAWKAFVLVVNPITLNKFLVKRLAHFQQDLEDLGESEYRKRRTQNTSFCQVRVTVFTHHWTGCRADLKNEPRNVTK